MLSMSRVAALRSIAVPIAACCSTRLKEAVHEPGGCTSLHSRSHSGMLTHPAQVGLKAAAETLVSGFWHAQVSLTRDGLESMGTAPAQPKR